MTSFLLPQHNRQPLSLIHNTTDQPPSLFHNTTDNPLPSSTTQQMTPFPRPQHNTRPPSFFHNKTDNPFPSSSTQHMTPLRVVDVHLGRFD
ncbi:hypothetical protein Pcinc_043604 [Petrolisthes cinctipes]|uniref:Uncharacterized protein n=1 Tax=Petrolisthes cinctipes TaxID=88211 RepID=A0AAE1BFN4_PETCI|nr:hypothetical protein Pcinc_043604 [Petrolisthes cinctipes]